MSTPRLIPVLDERLSQSTAPYGITVGPASVNSIVTAASSASSSVVTASVVPPSSMMVLDRANCLLSYTAQLAFQVTQSTTAPNGVRCITPGLSFAASPYFLHQLCNSAQVTLNNATSSVQFGQSFAAIRRLMRSVDIKSWQGCASKLPQIADNNVAWGTNASVISDGSAALNENELGNGAFPIVFCDATFTALPIGTAGTYNDAGTTGIVVSYDNQGRIITSAATNGHPFMVFVQIPIVERILISPLAYFDASEDVEGISSLTSFSLNYSLGSLAAARAIQWNTVAEGSTIANLAFGATPFASFNVLTTWCTPSVTAPRAPRSVLPYTAIQPYQSGGTAIAAASTATAVHQMNSIQLPQIPTAIVVWVEVPAATYTANPTLAEQFLPITAVNLSFANTSGLMSNFTPFQLYTASKHAGLQGMSWPVFRGRMCVGGSNVQTVGSMLVLKPGSSFQLPAGYSPSQAGSFNISAQITTGSCGIACTPVVNLLCVYDGQLSLDENSGSTSCAMLGLSEAQVLEAQRSDEKVSSSSARGLSGARATGGFLGAFLGPALGIGRSLLAMAAPHLVKGVVDGALGKVFGQKKEKGSGLTGGARTGGGVGDGRLSLADRLAM
jgi:hypothetical protein